MNAEDERQQPGADAPPGKLTALEQPFDAGSLYALRAAVAAHAAGAGLSRLRVYDVTAVAHELAANAVVHGAGNGLLRLWADGGFLYCEVSDQGLGATENAAGEPAPGDGPWRAQRGHGLWLAGQVTDRLSIDHGPSGTTATARFPLAPG